MTNLSLNVTDPAGKQVGSVDLPASIFDRDPNIALMHQVVNAQLAAARQGTHSTKTRGRVRGGGSPWPTTARLLPAHPQEDEGGGSSLCPV